MYIKKSFSLLLVSLFFSISLLGIRTFTIDNDMFIVSAKELEKAEKVEKEFIGQVQKSDGGQRVIQCNQLIPQYCISVTNDDIDALMKIVEAEAGCEKREGKLLVANVIINRVKNGKFPNSVKKVVYQKEQNITQFSPVANGRINTVKVSEETKDVVYAALRGEDNSNGALYFMARKYSKPENVQWFDTHLTYVLKSGGHEFYR